MTKWRIGRWPFCTAPKLARRKKLPKFCDIKSITGLQCKTFDKFASLLPVKGRRELPSLETLAPLRLNDKTYELEWRKGRDSNEPMLVGEQHRLRYSEVIAPSPLF